MKYLAFFFLLINAYSSFAQCSQPSYCNRACWDPNGDYPAETTPTSTIPTHIIVHHTGDGTIFPEDTDFKEVVQYYWDLHVNTNGWDDIGYNWLIDRNGVVYEGRGNEILGAHFSCMSSNTTGISLIGNFEIEEPSAEAINSLKNLVAWEATDKDIDVENVSYHTSSELMLANLAGHRDGNSSTAAHSCAKGTVCPGKNLYSQLPTIRSSVSDLDCYDNTIPTLNCSNAIPLQCGIKYYGESSKAASTVSLYGCNSWTETGPERVHTITPTIDGPLSATISNFTGDLDVYILGSCDPMDCLGTVSSSSSIYEEAKAGETYYIVVDADDGSGSSYELLVECAFSTTPEDIFLHAVAMNPEQIQAGNDLKVWADLEYSGPRTSAELPEINLAYYLSTSCNLSVNDVFLGSDAYRLGSDANLFSTEKNIQIPTETAAGNYYLLVVADNGNQLAESNENNNSKCLAFTNTLSIGDFEFERQLKVYPNPTKDFLHLQTGNDFRIEKIMLYSGNGTIMKEVDETNEMNIQELPSGMYLLKVYSEDQKTAVFKVVKE